MKTPTPTQPATTIPCPYCKDDCFLDNGWQQPGDDFDIWTCEMCCAEIHTTQGTTTVIESFDPTPSTKANQTSHELPT